MRHLQLAHLRENTDVGCAAVPYRLVASGGAQALMPTLIATRRFSAVDRCVRRALALGTLLVLGPALGSAVAQAATINVTTTADERAGRGSGCALREAIRSANADQAIGGCASGSGTDAIAVPEGTYDLTLAGSDDTAASGDLDLRRAVTIAGGGQGATVDAGGAAACDGTGAEFCDRVFDVFASTEMTGVTIRGGNPDFNTTTGSPAQGGGVRVHANRSFSLVDGAVVGNHALGGGGGGGGIANAGTMVLRDAVIAGNQAGFRGGISNFAGSIPGAREATATLTRVTVRDNIAGYGAAGIYNSNSVSNATGSVGDRDTLVIEDSTISGNTLTNGTGDVDNGAGIASGGSTTLTNVTIDGNKTQTSGGGVAVFGGTTTLRHSTVTNNRADDYDGVLDPYTPGGEPEYPGGDGTGNGGGLFRSGGDLNLRATIVYGNLDNTPPGGTHHHDCSGSVTSQGYTLIHQHSGCTITGQPTDFAAGTHPQLYALVDNGGPTKTHALGTFGGPNPMIDAVPTPCPSADQRGVPRPHGSGCDVGAYEYATCQTVVVNRVGTAGPDVLTGTSGADGFLSFGGADEIIAGAGADGACSGSDNDTVSGGADDDRLAGGSENDDLAGTTGNDRLFGQDGDDVLLGGVGADRLDGGVAFFDSCNGGPDADSDVATDCETETAIP